MKKIFVSTILVFMLGFGMQIVVADCDKTPLTLPGMCSKTYLMKEYKLCQDRAEQKAMFCTNPDQIVEAMLHVQYTSEEQNCKSKAKSDQAQAQRGYSPADKVVFDEGCHCIKEGLGNYDAHQMALNLKKSGMFDALYPTLAAEPAVFIDIRYPATAAAVAPMNFFTFQCPLQMQELAFKKILQDGLGGHAAAPSLAEISQSLAASSMIAEIELLMKATISAPDGSKKPFLFDKWKYFDDQYWQYAQCGRFGFIIAGEKCQNDHPLGSSVTAGFGSRSDYFCDNQGSCQDLIKLPKSTKIVFASIHLSLPATGNVFALKLGPNRGIQSYERHVRIDGGGITTMDVHYPEGQLIIDKNNNLLWPLLGSTTYYGSGTDAYETNTAIWDMSSALLTVTTNQHDPGDTEQPNPKISGAQTYAPPLLTTGLTLNHYYLSNFENAIDIGRNADGFNILARGNADMAIFGFGGYFPFLIRSVLKGDSVIVKNQDMSVATGYLAKDGAYSYLIFPLEGSTKVATEKLKIIQDASGIPRNLSNRERKLIYWPYDGPTKEGPKLKFE